MSVFGKRLLSAVVVALVAALWVSATLAGQTGASASKGETEWRFFGSDTGATRYSPANQINASNVRDLRVAWRWSARNFGPRPATQMQVSPLIIDGVMYTTAGVNRDVVALDAATGQLLWHWRPTGELREMVRHHRAGREKLRPRRHLLDGWRGDERIFVVMNSYMLVALDAKTGRQVASFGKNGVVDMAENLRWNERPGLPREGRVANTSPPAIVGNVLVASISMHTGAVPNLPGASINEQWPMNIPGDVVAYDTKTGKMLWRFNIIPRPGEEGAETWLTADPKVWEVPRGLNAWVKERPDLRESSNRYTGNAGFWAPVTADPELGMFYIATESPTSDYYGGYRPGNNLYANSVLALNAKTGKRAWHFQMTHHDIWDYDPPTAPMLADITVEGRPVKAVIQLTKQGFVFVFDRTTGKPVWPIEERPVPKSDIPGEWTSPTQPFPTKPAGIDVQGVTEERPRRLHARDQGRGASRRASVPSWTTLHAVIAAECAGWNDGHVDRAFRRWRRQLAGRCRRSGRRRPLCCNPNQFVSSAGRGGITEHGSSLSQPSRSIRRTAVDCLRPSAHQASLRACHCRRFEDG